MIFFCVITERKLGYFCDDVPCFHFVETGSLQDCDASVLQASWREYNMVYGWRYDDVWNQTGVGTYQKGSKEHVNRTASVWKGISPGDSREITKYRSDQYVNCWKQWRTDESVEVLCLSEDYKSFSGGFLV